MRRLGPLALTIVLFLPHCSSSKTTAPASPPAQAAAVTPPAVQPASTGAPAANLNALVPLDPDVRRGVLPNGLIYYIRANHKPEKRAELRLAVNAGSILESDEQRGLAHFVEHMAFNGTKNFPKQELVNYLERIGMRFGPDINAYTSFDETVYMLELPTDDPKIVDTGFNILRDWAGAVTFDDAAIQKERGVITEEWRLGRGAGQRIRDKQFPVIFHGSKYAERLPIGEKDIIQNAPADRIRQFYRDWYRPDLMAIVAVGDFDPAAVEKLIRDRFGSLPKKSGPARVEFPVPDHTETLTSIVTDKEATGINVAVEFKRPPVKEETVGELRQSLVDGLYHLMMNQRLAELGREANPPYQMAYAGSGPLGRTKSAYRLFASVNDGGVERALTTLLTEATRVDKYGFAQTELDRAKTLYLRSIDRAYDERDKQESSRFASEYVDNFLEHDAVPGISYERDFFHQVVPGITLAEVNARANQWITDQDRVILVSGPEKPEAKIPDEQQVLAVFNAADKIAVTPWVDRVLNEPLVAQEPQPGKVVDEKKFADVGITQWKLSNGTVVYLKPTDFKNDEVLIHAYRNGGRSLAPDSMLWSAQLSAGMVSRMGAGKFDVTELGKALTGKVASASPYVADLFEGVQGSASPRDLETAFQLLYLRFTAPRRDEKAFESAMTNLRGQLEHQEASPQYWFAKKWTEVTTQNNPRRRLLTAAELKNVDLDQALSFYRDRFADATGFVFTIVGNFDPAAIRPMVEKYIGGLPAAGKSETFRNEHIETPDGVQKVKVEKGIEPRSTVRIMFHGKAKWSPDEDARLDTLADLLRIRLREELREDKGGVYGVSVGATTTKYPEEKYSFSISFATDPKRVDELVAAVFKEIDAVKANGPDDDHVNRVREQQKRSREVELKQNGYWANEIDYLTRYGLDFGEVKREGERIDAITRDSIRDTARKYLDEKQYVLGVLDPEKAAAPASGTR